MSKPNLCSFALAWIPLFFSSGVLFCQQKARITTKPSSVVSENIKASNSVAPQCPNQGGILDSISVPVSQSITLYVVTTEPAPQGGAYFQLSSEEASVVAAGDKTQAFLPEVFIPEGETVSGAFEIFGIQTGQTALDIMPETPGYIESSTPTTAWSVNPDDDGSPQFTAFVDANSPGDPCRDEGASTISSQDALLSVCGENVGGVVSDGVTPLLLRTVTGLAGTACFAITSSSLSLDQGSIATPVAMTKSVGDDDFLYAFSLYTAPATYGDNSESRQVNMQFSFTPSLGNGNTTTINACAGCDLLPLTVIRPPLVLIHGLWSNDQTWSQGPAEWFRAGEYYVVEPMNYEQTNAASFSVNFPEVQKEVKIALDDVRDLDSGFAATQVDVVGHSMGGLLTRLYAGGSNFQRSDNLDEGDIRRLVTLDTPHFGASTANLIVSMWNNSLIFRTIGYLLSGVRGLGFKVPVFNQGAVCDLAENSPALQSLSGGTDLAAQVISATGGPPGEPTGGRYLSPLETALTLPLFPQSIVNDFRFRETNDTVVPLSSQLAGLPLLYENSFSEDSSGQTIIHTNVQNSRGVASQTFSLLDGPASGFSDSLPSVSSNGLGNPLTVPGRGAALDQQDYAVECTPGNPLKPNNSALKVQQNSVTFDSRVQITSPTAGQAFAPGDTVNVTVQLSGGLNASAVFVGPEVAGSGPIVANLSQTNTYQASFQIPNNFAGPLTIDSAALDSNQNPIAGIPATISVLPSSAPSSLVLAGGTYTHLSAAPSNRAVHVWGVYSNGARLDLSSSVTGTTYTSSNPNVLAVDANGNVSILGFGTAIVEVANSGLNAFSTFVVEDSASPLAPQDVTNSLNTTATGFRLNRSTGFFDQTVQISNSSAFPIVGPLYFIVSNLPKGVTLITNSGGKTQTIPTIGSPYIRMKLQDGRTIQPGASISLSLQFLDPSLTQINYTPRIFRKLGTP